MLFQVYELYVNPDFYHFRELILGSLVHLYAVVLPLSVRKRHSALFLFAYRTPLALLVWDHIICFGAEVRRIWSRKFSGATVLYSLLRYGTLLEKITIMVLASWDMTPHVSALPFYMLGPEQFCQGVSTVILMLGFSARS